MSNQSASTTKHNFFARVFGGAGGVIEPDRKMIIIAVLLGVIVGAISSKPKASDGLVASSAPVPALMAHEDDLHH